MDRRLRVRWVAPYHRIMEGESIVNSIVGYGKRTIMLNEELDIKEVERIIVVNLWFVVFSFSWTRLADAQ